MYGRRRARRRTWRGLAVAPQERCSRYNRKKDYRYSRSIEKKIVAAMGGRIFCPYTKESFDSTDETDIEHIVSLSEAHDSGLCKKNVKARRRFATDIRNLTLAPPPLNEDKGAKDAADWLPPENRCWYAGRVVAVKRRHRLTVDAAEARALEKILRDCRSREMEGLGGGGEAPGLAGSRTGERP